MTALARTVEGFDRRFDTVKTEAFEAGAAVKRELVDAMESAAEETEKAFRQVHGDVAKVEAELAAAAADRVATDETTRAELEAIVSAESAASERCDIEEKIVDAETDAKVERSSRAQNSPRTPRTPPRKRRAEQRRRCVRSARRWRRRIGGKPSAGWRRRRIRRKPSAEMAEAKDQTQAIRAEMAEANDQTQAICAEMANA